MRLASIQRSRSAGTTRSPRVPREVLRFAAVVMLVAAILGVGGFFVLSQGAITEAQRGAEEITRIQGLSIVQPLLTDSVLTGDPSAIAQLDEGVRARVIDSRTVRVKIWDRTGRIVYSDKATLIGETFQLGANELEALDSNRVDSYVSDLSKPENRFERSFGQLLEVYLPLKTASGQKVLFETYQEFQSVQAEQQRLMLEFGPVLAGGLLVLVIVEAPLAWSMARRLEAGALEREMLLTRTIEASELERRRIAGDLHDGVVQRLAGTSMSLSVAAQGMARTTASGPDKATATTVERAAGEVREAVRELRTLIVKIAPKGLTAETLPDALHDLVEPLRASGIEPELRIEPCTLDQGEARLVFRVAQEAVRNVVQHARAKHVTVEILDGSRGRRLAVSDDGRGFDPATAIVRQDGHVGLRLLQSLAADSGAELVVDSAPGKGSRVELSLP